MLHMDLSIFLDLAKFHIGVTLIMGKFPLKLLSAVIVHFSLTYYPPPFLYDMRAVGPGQYLMLKLQTVICERML